MCIPIGIGLLFCVGRVINYLCIMSASWYCSFPHLSRPLCFFLSSVPRGDRTQVHRLSVGVSSSLVGVLVVVRCELPGGYALIVLRVCKTVVVRIAVVNTWYLIVSVISWTWTIQKRSRHVDAVMI